MKCWNIREFRKKNEKNDPLCTLGNDNATPGAHKMYKKFEILVDETGLLGYNESIVDKNKAVKRRVGDQVPFREPRNGGMGYGGDG